MVVEFNVRCEANEIRGGPRDCMVLVLVVVVVVIIQFVSRPSTAHSSDHDMIIVMRRLHTKAKARNR